MTGFESKINWNGNCLSSVTAVVVVASGMQLKMQHDLELLF